jgi:plastocyanin
MDRHEVLDEARMSKHLTAAAVVAFAMGGIVGVAAARTITVAQHGLQLSMSSATIAKGDRIVFTNEDDVIHNIHIFGENDFDKDLGLQKPGKTLSFVFAKPGTYRVRCNIHPSVKMTVVVK